ncbi:MAG: hypothetical protein K0B02_00550 [DPANN group archaeon]|nr:hypothetical protein [DPANN group archaeon]
MYKKGYAFERLLKLELEADGWKVIRSGGSKKPDMIAGKNGKIIIIECKSSKNSKVYIDKDEFDNIQVVAKAFNAECIFAIRQDRKKWVMVSLDQLKENDKSYVINLE